MSMKVTNEGRLNSHRCDHLFTRYEPKDDRIRNFSAKRWRRAGGIKPIPPCRILYIIEETAAEGGEKKFNVINGDAE